MSLKNFWIFPVIVICCLFLYYPSLNYYFFQDDWFVLNWVRTGDIASFFSFRTDIIYYRPITMPVFFGIGKLLFNLNPFGFHLIAFLFHLINSYLVYLIFKSLNVKELYSKFGAYIYATSAFHFIGLSWLSTTSYIIGPTFIFASLITYLKLKVKASFLFFILALGSTEFAAVVLPLIVLIGGIKKKTFLHLIPFVVIVSTYIIVRLFVFPIPAKGQYQVLLDPGILVNIAWYLAWVFNFGEKFSTIFFYSNIGSFPQLFMEFWKYLVLPTILIMSFIGSLILLKKEPYKIIFGSFWFLIGLVPVLLVANHVYPIYLAVSSIGIIYIILCELEKLNLNKKAVLFSLAMLWFMSTYLTFIFTRQTHWISNLQAVSKSYVETAKEKTQNPENNSTFVFSLATIKYANNNKFTLVEGEGNVKQSLNDQDAIKVVYDNNTLLSTFLDGREDKYKKGDNTIYEILPE